jgi:hypothetical protein
VTRPDHTAEAARAAADLVATAAFAMADLHVLLGQVTLEVTCDRCKGTGEVRVYEVGPIGEPEWCDSCGGPGRWEQPGALEYTERKWGEVE